MQLWFTKAALVALLVITSLEPSTMAEEPAKTKEAAKTAQAEAATKAAEAAKLDQAYEQVWQHITNTYLNSPPNSWNPTRTRFQQKLQTSGHVRGSIALSLTTIGDRRLCVLDPYQVEDYLCRQGSGFVGIGIMFKMVEPKESNKKPYVIVESVTKGSPAALANIKAGDIVRKISSTDMTGCDMDLVMRYATYGNLGTEIPLQLERDGKQIDVTLKRSIVELPKKAVDLQFFQDEPDLKDKQVCKVTFKNLDWRNLPAWVDNNVAKIESRQLTIDLRGCRGDDVEIMARVAARFVESGELLRYSERKGAIRSIVTYRVENQNGRTELLSSRDGVWQTIEKGFPQNLSGDMTAIIDDNTSGTAEAFVHALRNANRADVLGTSAGANTLVVTSILDVADTSLYVQVPARTLLTSENSPLPAIKVASASATPPNADVGGTKPNVPILILSGCAIVCFLMALSIMFLRHGKTWKMHMLALGLVVLGLIVAVRANSLKLKEHNKPVSKQTSSQATKTDAQKAAALLVNLLRTDKEVRTDYGIYKQVTQRGKLDAPEPPDTGKFPMVPDTEIEAACRIVTALTETDLTSLRTIVASYAHKPYARAQIAFCVESALRKLNARYHIMALEGWLFFEQMGGHDGGFTIQFSALDNFADKENEPFVSHWLKNGDRGHSATQPKDISNEEVLKAFSLDIIQSVLTADPKP